MEVVCVDGDLHRRGLEVEHLPCELDFGLISSI